MFRLISLFFLALYTSFYGQEKMMLWPKDVPNQKKSSETEIVHETDIIRIKNVQFPTIEIYLPAKSM